MNSKGRVSGFDFIPFFLFPFVLLRTARIGRVSRVANFSLSVDVKQANVSQPVRKQSSSSSL